MVKLFVNPDVVSHLMTFTRVITFMSEFCVFPSVQLLCNYSVSERKALFTCNDYSQYPGGAVCLSVRRAAFWGESSSLVRSYITEGSRWSEWSL